MARDPRSSREHPEREDGVGGAANGADDGALPEENELHANEPAELASGEVDIADAQLAMGRPDLAASEADGDDRPLGGSTAGELFESAREDDGGPLVGPSAGVAPSGSRAPAEAQKGSRFGNFLRGSWRELQRVQWPDRRQVAQATAVVVGFVAIAGAFLGGADWVSARIVDLIV